MPILTPGRIRHSVVFSLEHEAGSDAEADFVAAITALEQIPGVEAFELMREVSPKNDFDFGLTMEFADRGGVRGVQRASAARRVRRRPLGCRSHPISWKSTPQS